MGLADGAPPVDTVDDLAADLSRALVERPPALAREGALFVAGYDRALDDADAENELDPRLTAIARTADLFIPVRSGGDIGVFYGMLHIMVQRGWINREFIAALQRAPATREMAMPIAD